jgi:diguanylate cyclase (GGDEF)-like protein/PAS domain S-box-containing protein
VRLLRLATVVVALAGLASATVAFAAAGRAVDSHEQALLQEKAGNAAGLLTALADGEQAHLGAVAAAMLSATPAGQLATQLAESGFSGVSVLHAEAAGYRVAGRTGRFAASIPPQGGLWSPGWKPPAGLALSFTGIVGGGAGRVFGVASAGSSLPSGDVAYGEIGLSFSESLGSANTGNQASNPFTGTNFALYLGTSELAGTVLFADAPTLPLTGERATVRLSGGFDNSAPELGSVPGSLPPAPGSLLLVMTRARTLGGATDDLLPWLALAVTVVIAVLIAALMEVTLRRRDRALALASSLRTTGEALRESERNNREIFLDNPQPMWAYDKETLRFLDVNDAAVAKYGYSRDEFLAMTIRDIRPVAEMPHLDASLLAQHTGSSVDSSGPWIHRLRDGRLIEVEVTSHMQTYLGRSAALVTARDITVQRVLEERLRHHALHDPLTGAGTRELLMHEIDSTDGAGAAPSSRCAIFLVDITAMRALNEMLGRDAGDELLVQVYDRLAGALDGPTTVARIGGDTFALLRFDIGAADTAMATGERIQAALTAPFKVRGHDVPVSASVGIALSEPGVEARQLLRNADTALQSARETGRRVAMFNIDDQAAALERRALESDLHRALAEGQFRLVYQPQLDLRTGVITGVEALARWHHPERGVIGPLEFIPMAERLGLITRLDAWAIGAACRQAREWIDAGLPPLNMAVNVSGHDLASGDQLVELVRDELARNRLAPERLELELTESVALRDHRDVEVVLIKIRELGVHIALDDFGTGYSMLDRIRDLPIDTLKIDRSFVRRTSSDGGRLVVAIINMARSLGMGVVAEGVETEQELAFVERNGCDLVQGYLISHPIAAEEVAALMQSRSAVAPAVVEPAAPAVARAVSNGRTAKPRSTATKQ